LFFCVFFSAAGLWAQDRVSYAAEIRELEGKISGQSLSGAALREAHERLALLFQLAGNIESAAGSWARASRAQPNERDLFRSAQCLAALGEWDRAQEILGPLLAASADTGLVLKARYLSALIRAFRSGGGDHALLASFVNDPGYGDVKAQTCYFLWKFSGRQEYKTMLVRDFPASPEARIAQGAPELAAAPTALWLLYPGGEVPGGAAQSTAPAVPARTAPSRTDAAASRIGEGTPGEGPAYIQTGLYGRVENARIQAGRLADAGFTASIIERSVNGSRYWAVVMPPGPDYNHTILGLKDAGFESFPVFDRP
jgi:tetratricopeptide (TPR) repeat protein